MSIGANPPFRPSGTVSLSVSIASAIVALPVGGDSLLVSNANTDYVFVRLGGPNAVATIGSDTPIAAGQRLLLHCPAVVSYMAVIANSGTGTVFATRGDGVTA